MAIEARELKKSYDDFSVSLSLEVAEGETLALVGPSGSGKTTVINMIAGLARPDSGKVIINGEDVSALPPWKRNISLVFQDLALFPHLDVGGNIAYGLSIRRVPKRERLRIIEETLNIVRLPGYASRRIQTLSGGERQRVALARSLASSPRALLLDEPFSSLDLPLRKEMRREFLEIRKRAKFGSRLHTQPCIFVTHDREEAAILGDKVALMAEGRIIEMGTGKDLFLAPKTEFAARFFGAGIVLSQSVFPEAAPLLFENVSPGKKLFIPHDAMSLEEQREPGWKSIGAYCVDSFFNGPNLVAKLSLREDPQTDNSFEVIAGPRTKPPASGNLVRIWIDPSLVRIVE